MASTAAFTMPQEVFVAAARVTAAYAALFMGVLLWQVCCCGARGASRRHGNRQQT